MRKLLLLSLLAWAFSLRLPSIPVPRLTKLNSFATTAAPTTNLVTITDTPLDTVNDDDVLMSSKLTSVQRISRAFSFYSAAVPLFLSYQLLKEKINLEKSIFSNNISEEEEEKQYDIIHDWGSELITRKIEELKGFYVKTGQIISTRVDIFPSQYTSKLSIMQDSLDPLPSNIVKKIVENELLEGGDLSELFSEFDDKPLGSASIGQVHRARLLSGQVVAVKVQRPSIDAKLLGDIANLKNFALAIKNFLPIDYYKIFCELEKTLIYELDFLHEAQATVKIASAINHSVNQKKAKMKAPLFVPLPIPGLVSKRVLVMEYVEGKALSKLGEEMVKRGITEGSAEAKLLGSQLLASLTEALGRMIFGGGIIHGDVHPGNIFVMKDGFALLDCGQIKQFNTQQRLGLAKLICAVDQYEKVDALRKNDPSNKQHEEERNKLITQLANSVRSFGVGFKEEIKGDECAAGVALILFGRSDIVLPGGFVGEELNANSPINKISDFPQELVLLGRATVMIKGIANRLGVTWSLANKWADLAKETMSNNAAEMLPIWSVSTPQIFSKEISARATNVKFREICRGFWSLGNLLRQYLLNKMYNLLMSNISDSSKKRLLQYYVRMSSTLQKIVK